MVSCGFRSLEGPLLSVVVPVYNGFSYLAGCLGSLAGQGFDDCEIIVVDDGSTDGSPGIAREFECACPLPVTVVAQANGGPYSARAAGIARARGRHMLFCDADDAFLPGAFGRIAALIEEHPSCDVLSFEVTRSLGRPDPFLGLPPALVSYEGDGLDDLLGEVCVGFVHNGLWNKAIRRELLQDLDSRHPRRLGEDLFVVAQVYDRARSALSVGECLYHYRETPGSIIRAGGLLPLEDLELLEAKLLSILEKRGLLGRYGQRLAQKNCLYAAMAAEAILSCSDPAVDRRAFFEKLRACEFVRAGIEGGGIGGLRPDLRPYVAFLDRGRFTAAAAYHAAVSLPKRLYRHCRHGGGR